MAKLAFSLTFLFLLFALTVARTPLDLSEIAVADRDPDLSTTTTETAVADSDSLPGNSDAEPTLLLPGEKEGSAVDETRGHLPEAETDTVSLDAVQITRPANLVRFRPINRRFVGNRQFPPRFSRRRPCPHFPRPMNPRFRNQEISYGNDMILSGEGKTDTFNPETFHREGRANRFNPETDTFRGEVRTNTFNPDRFRGEVPEKWLSFNPHHHHHHHHGFMPMYMLKRPFHHEEEREEHEGGFMKRPFHHEEEREEREGGFMKRPFHHHEEEREENEGGFMKRVRKFLNHHF